MTIVNILLQTARKSGLTGDIPAAWLSYDVYIYNDNSDSDHADDNPAKGIRERLQSISRLTSGAEEYVRKSCFICKEQGIGRGKVLH